MNAETINADKRRQNRELLDAIRAHRECGTSSPQMLALVEGSITNVADSPRTSSRAAPAPPHATKEET
ncbi:hypothetical protein [Rhodococcus sp. R1101]|uniref:hypothetical protein n=1 Tax=Rhodococcus sp. R1101 TaxID=1170698 RepID=UPI0012F6A9EE|nr:hypothetical protein [Rhodococcus sp. R1101]